MLWNVSQSQEGFVAKLFIFSSPTASNSLLLHLNKRRLMIEAALYRSRLTWRQFVYSKKDSFPSPSPASLILWHPDRKGRDTWWVMGERREERGTRAGTWRRLAVNWLGTGGWMGDTTRDLSLSLSRSAGALLYSVPSSNLQGRLLVRLLGREEVLPVFLYSVPTSTASDSDSLVPFSTEHIFLWTTVYTSSWCFD